MLISSLLKTVPFSRKVRQISLTCRNYIRVVRDFNEFSRLSATSAQTQVPLWRDRWFQLNDYTSATHFDRHYVYHTAWAVRQLAAYQPKRHVDISSSLYFVALGSVLVPIEHIDYRPPKLLLDNVICKRGDLHKLPLPDESVESLSCMHVIEHVGLGRYGDPLDPLGDAKSARELIRILAMGGRLLIVLPVGRPRICFNAHRVYGYSSVIRLFEGVTLENWALIPDDSNLGIVERADPESFDVQSYGCGCFLFRKNAVVRSGGS